MQMIESLLRDTKKEIGGPEGKVNYVLCFVVEGNNKNEPDFVHQHGHGYIQKTLGAQMRILEGGPEPFKVITFGVVADGLMITRTDRNRVAIGLKDISEVSEHERDIALDGLIKVVANDVDEFILEYAKGFNERITIKPGKPMVDMTIPKKRRH